MADILQFPEKANAAFAVLNRAPSRGAKGALERAINKTLERKNHIASLEDTIMCFLWLEGYRIVPLDGKEGETSHA